MTNNPKVRSKGQSRGNPKVRSDDDGNHGKPERIAHVTKPGGAVRSPVAGPKASIESGHMSPREVNYPNTGPKVTHMVPDDRNTSRMANGDRYGEIPKTDQGEHPGLRK